MCVVFACSHPPIGLAGIKQILEIPGNGLFPDSRQRCAHLDPAFRRIILGACANDDPIFDFQVVAGHEEAALSLRSAGALDLDRHLWLSSLFNDKVDFSTIGRPVIERNHVGASCEDKRLEYKTLPTRSDDRVTQQLMKRTDLQERMNEPAVANVDLWRLHKTLAEIAAPWLQTANQHEVNEEVDRAANHGRRYTQTLGKPRAIQNIPWLFANIVQKRPIVAAGMRGANIGTSRSR